MTSRAVPDQVYQSTNPSVTSTGSNQPFRRTSSPDDVYMDGVHEMGDKEAVRCVSPAGPGVEEQTAIPYRTYRMRFAGVTAITCLNIIAGLVWPWFGPIANDTSEAFRISTARVNWLSNSVQLGTFVCSIFVPFASARIGLRRCFLLGQALLIISGWIRYAATAHSLSVGGAYAILIVAQLLSSVPTAFFLNLAPLYSERWFSTRGRTTATMIMSIANPFGGAVGQVLSPLVGTPRQSILVLAIICAAGTPLVFLVHDRPPTPPSLAGSSHPSPKLTVLALFGQLRQGEEGPASLQNAVKDRQSQPLFMTRRERLDFTILTLAFSALVASCNSFSLLSNEILEPYGYSSDTAGFMGGTLLLAGIIGAIVTSPIFDRVLVHRFGLACKLLCPIIGAAWLSLVWVVRENNAVALYIIFGVIGVCSLTLLPIALELGVELTRNADTSASILWGASYVVTIIFVLSASPLRASSTANPPLNMRDLLILIATVDLAFICLVFAFKGKQTRRGMDEGSL